jgi:hypothetical protein
MMIDKAKPVIERMLRPRPQARAAVPATVSLMSQSNIIITIDPAGRPFPALISAIGTTRSLQWNLLPRG